MNRNTKRIVAIGTPLAAVAASGIAFAAWTSTGNGTGSATALSAQPVTLSTATTTDQTGKLYPGANGDVVVSVDNGNPYNVSLGSVALTHAYNASGYTDANNTGTDIQTACALTINGTPTLVAAPGTHTYVIANAVTMGSDAVQATCQGVTFVLTLTSTATQTSATAQTPAT